LTWNVSRNPSNQASVSAQAFAVLVGLDRVLAHVLLELRVRLVPLGVDEPAQVRPLFQLDEPLEPELLIPPQPDVHDRQSDNGIGRRERQQAEEPPAGPAERFRHRVDGRDRRRHLVEQEQTEQTCGREHQQTDERVPKD
jgi:hypothetical protein